MAVLKLNNVTTITESSGSLTLANAALGTPTSGVMTNMTGTPSAINLTNATFPTGHLIKTTAWKDTTGTYTTTGSTPKTMIDSVPYTLVATKTYVVKLRFASYGKMNSASHTIKTIPIKFKWGDSERLQGTTPSDDDLGYFDLGAHIHESSGSGQQNDWVAFDCVIPYGSSGAKHFFVTMHGAGNEWTVACRANATIPYFFFIEEYEGDIDNTV